MSRPKFGRCAGPFGISVWMAKDETRKTIKRILLSKSCPVTRGVEIYLPILYLVRLSRDILSTQKVTRGAITARGRF